MVQKAVHSEASSPNSLGPTNIYIYVCVWRVGCLPLTIITTPFLIRRSSPGSRREWLCERGGALKQPGLAAYVEVHLNRIEPHHRRCLNGKRASTRETGLFPVHARRCPRGSMKGEWREFRAARDVSRRTLGPDKPYTWYGSRARMPGRPVPSSTVGKEVDEAAVEATTPRAPDLRGERVRLPDSALTWTLPSQTPQHDKDTRSPVYFGHFIPFGHFYFIISVQ